MSEENESKAIVVAEQNLPLTVESIRAQVNLITGVMKGVMKENVHYGLIPGCGDRPTLLKPGAEKLCVTFRLAPKYNVVINNLPGGHREYEITCSLTHINSGLFFGEGLGVCSTMESKYRYRNANRKCPTCGEETIIKGKEEYGGGWLCWTKNGGCGEKFDDNDQDITLQDCGKVENPDPADCYNTVKKMAKKRAHVDATLTALAASDIFYQDLEDLPNAPDNTKPKNSAPEEPPVTEGAPHPANTGQAPATSTNTVIKNDYMKDERTNIWENLLSYAGGVEEEARDALTLLTAFNDFKGYNDINRVSNKVMDKGVLLKKAQSAADTGEITPF